jgi:hypothetical protein
MKNATAILAFLSILILCPVGCVSKSRAQLQAQQAYVAGQEKTLEETRPKPQVVTVTGPVRNSVIPWTEELTLANAIIAADYTAYLRPRFIRVTRNGESITVNPNDLLLGQDMPLLAGDVVEVVP